MKDRIYDLVSRLANTKTASDLFNPYNDLYIENDISTAPGIRQLNLRIFLEKYLSIKPKTLWVFDFADYNSSNKTGVPLLEPHNYKNVETILGMTDHFEYANRPKVISKSSSNFSNIWNTISSQKTPYLIWYLLPFYPHAEGDMTKTRKPSTKEYDLHIEYFHEILTIYKPDTIVVTSKEIQLFLSNLKIKSKLLVV